MVVDVAEAGSAVVVMDVPSYRHISPPVVDLNARSVIVLAIMLTNGTIVVMIRLAQLLFSNLMGIVQSIPTGASLLYSPVSSFVLKNLLHVSDITKNLLSVSQFIADNKVLLEFHPDSCFIKDLSTRKTLLRGQLKDGLYVFSLGNYNFTASPQALLSERASSSVWHERLGYPSTRVVSSVLSQRRLPFFTDRIGTPLCIPCQQGKSHHLPFSSSSTIATLL